MSPKNHTKNTNTRIGMSVCVVVTSICIQCCESFLLLEVKFIPPIRLECQGFFVRRKCVLCFFEGDFSLDFPQSRIKTIHFRRHEFLCFYHAFCGNKIRSQVIAHLSSNTIVFEREGDIFWRILCLS